MREAPGASVWPEILPLEIVNWPLLIVRLPMIKLALPSLVTVTFFVALDEPTCTEPKSMEGWNNVDIGFRHLRHSVAGA